MNLNEFFIAMSKKKQTFVSVLIIFVLIAILITALLPFKYGSSLRLLTVHSFKETTDPYMVSKSNEHLSNLLSKITYSNLFFENIKSTAFNIDKDYFGDNEKKQMETWKKTVRSKSIGDTGIMAIDVYHTDRDQAREIARAIVFIIKRDHDLYHGFGKSVEIKEIDKPITSTFPVKPNIVLNLTLAVIFSIIFSLSYIYLFPEEDKNIRLWPRGKKREETKTKTNWESVGEVMKRREEYDTIRPTAESEVNQNVSEDENSSHDDFSDQGNMSNILKKD